MIKQFSSGDIITRPFKTFKNWQVQSVDVSGSDSYGRSTYINNMGEVNRGKKIESIFYPSGSPKYDPILEPMTNGKYERNIYSLTDTMFYKNSDNPMETFGVENASKNTSNGGIEVREIHDKIVTLRLANNFWGEKIVPKSVKIVDNSSPHNTYEIYDDGATNLYITGSHFSTETKLSTPVNLPPEAYWDTASGQFYVVINDATQSITYNQAKSYMDMGMDVTYVEDVSGSWIWDNSVARNYFDPENERFGQSVSSWYKYIAVGSPMDSMNIAPSSSRQGYAAIYKYDENVGQHRLVKKFYSPQSQNGLANEFPHDTNLLIQLENGHFWGLEGTGSLEDGFGYSVSVGDNFLAIGAPTGSVCLDTGSNSGFVYVYDKYKGGTDHWGIINVLQGATPNDRFGSSVSIDGNILAVGAPGVSSSLGEVYIFRKKRYMDSTYPCQSIETSSFFYKIGDCGQPLVDATGSIIYTTGSTPTFVSGNYSWEYETTLTSSVSQPGDYFGSVLEVDNNKIIIGNRKTSGPGYASIFVCSYVSASIGACPTASWAESYVYRSNNSLGDLSGSPAEYAIQIPLSFDGFGWSVALDGDNAAVGSYYDLGAIPYVNAPLSLLRTIGAMYFYHNYEDVCGITNYRLIQKTFGKQNCPDCDLFGRLVSIDGLKAAVAYEPTSKYYQVDLSGSFILESSSYQSTGPDDAVLGRILMYDLQPDNTWVQSGEIRRNKEGGKPFYAFGKSLSLSSDFLAVGAPIYNFIGSSSSFEDVVNFNNQISYSFSPEYSGSVFVHDFRNYKHNSLIGNFFYKNGYATITNTSSNYDNILTGTGSFGFRATYQGTHTIFENEYLVSVRPGEFNYSTNPSSLIQSPNVLDVNGDGIFDFTDLDLIMRYLHKKRFYEDFIFDDNGIILEQDTLNDHSWWNNDLLLTEAGDVLLQESEYAAYLVSSSFTQFTKTTFDYIENNLVNTGILDIDGDGKINLDDGAILTVWFVDKLTPAFLSSRINDSSIRRYVSDVSSYIEGYTGAKKFNVDSRFFGYQASSSYDPTGSYLSPFITTIGLYDSSNRLVAVGKLGRPIKNLIDWPINFIVRFDT